MTVLLDLNVILDVLLSREPWRAEASAIWDANRDRRISAHVAASAVSTLFYIVRKHVDLARAHLAVEACPGSLAIATVERSTLESASRMSGIDFEDNVQIACAIQSGVEAIITRDAKGFGDCSVQVMSPGELLARLNTGQSSS